MVKRFSTLVLCACLRIASGQIDSNSVTVTATRTVNLQPDQASFTVTVTTPVAASPDEVVAALQGSGIGIANLVSVGPPNSFLTGSFTGPGLALPRTLGPGIVIHWTFSATVPSSMMKNEFAALASVASSVKEKNQDFSGSFAFTGTSISQAALDATRQTVVADLIADAKARAKQLTDAAGLGLGTILSISELSSTSLGIASAMQQPTFTLAVRFGLLRFN